MKKDETPRTRLVTAANDNPASIDPDAVDAALTRVAEAIGRHIAREHIRTAANDNELQKNPSAPKR
ncbi:hypothetical protein [Sphingopyxis granuli]|uniref:Uncharacterized protein n=1 Tax=Sphingopyxis granuli TaxID=267128 RepID=A0AA86GKF8_9SPHN|nr:hypothetical protein [Sphingopyxis granuli]AMG73841.1 Uncharacterized protein SGRAN_1452 [Sphingopyxis granuli]